MIEQVNDDELRAWINDIATDKSGFPDGYKDSPIYKKGLTDGYQKGYMNGLHTAWKEANIVINTVRNILELHDRRYSDDLEEDE